MKQEEEYNETHIMVSRGTQIFQKKSRSHITFLGARKVTTSKSCIEDPQILGVTVQNLATRATWSR
jgi:hypothetical protein